MAIEWILALIVMFGIFFVCSLFACETRLSRALFTIVMPMIYGLLGSFVIFMVILGDLAIFLLNGMAPTSNRLAIYKLAIWITIFFCLLLLAIQVTFMSRASPLDPRVSPQGERMMKSFRVLLITIGVCYILQLIIIYPRRSEHQRIFTGDERHAVSLELRNGAKGWDALAPGWGLFYHWRGRAVYVKTRDGRYQIDRGDSYDSFDLDGYRLKVRGAKASLRGPYQWSYEWDGTADECLAR